MTDAYTRLIAAQKGSLRGDFAGARAQLRIVVERVARDDMKNPLIAYGRQEGTPPGSPVYPVHILGRAEVEDREVILGEYEKGSAANPTITYAGHVATTYAGAGSARMLPGPTPAFLPGTSWYSTEAEALTGATASFVTIYFFAVPIKYRPTRYLVSYRTAAGEWSDVPVPGPGEGILQCRLPRPFPSGVSVDVKLRAEYAISYGPSLESETKSLVTAADTTHAGAINALAVDVSAPAQLTLTPSATIDPDRFLGFRYEISDSPSGAPDTVSEPIAGPWSPVLPPGDYYVAARTVSRAGVLGPRLPLLDYQGPYTVQAPAAPLDTTPPPVPDPPTVVGLVWIGVDGVERAKLRLTLPEYAKPDDFSHFVATIVHRDTGLVWPEIVLGEEPAAAVLGLGVLAVSGEPLVGVEGDNLRQVD